MKHVRGVAVSAALLVALLLGSDGSAAAVAEARWRGMDPVKVLEPIPAGLTLPVYLLHGVRAGAAKAGQQVEGTTTEAVPLTQTTYLPAGARVEGRVLASRAADRRAGVAAMLVIEFDRVSYRGTSVPLRARVLAVANATEVSRTFASSNDGSDRGNASPANWTTQQIGGDEVFREGWEGPVEDASMQRVGYADFRGVYANAPGRAGTAAVPRAVGVFSTTASGLYGFDAGARLEASGGKATFTSPEGLVVRTGDALLLEVVAGAGGEAGRCQ
jgi:hypothetical protein